VLNNKQKNMGDVPSRFLKTLTIEDQLDAIQDLPADKREKLQRAIAHSLFYAVKNGNEEEQTIAAKICSSI
jgi:hypothetical protein